MAQANWMIGQDKERARKQYAELARKKTIAHWDYYTVVTSFKGWQVTRHFFIHSTYSQKKGYWLDFLSEVNQGWLYCTEDGDLSLEIFQRKKRCFWYGSNQPYALSSPMVWKPWRADYTRGGCDMFGHDDEYIYPIRRITPTINANGLGKYIGRLDDLNLISSVAGWNRFDRTYLDAEDEYQEREKGKHKALKMIERSYLPTKVETLYKTGDELLGMLMLGRSYAASRLYTYWQSYLVAKRHGLKLRSESEVCDWLDYVADLETLGRDIHSPKYLVPADLGKEHGKIIDKLAEIRRKTKSEIDKKQREADNRGYVNRMHRFFSLCISNENLDIRPLRSVDEFEEEGDAMHHCVYRMGYYKPDKHCLILSAKDKDGKRVETIEVNLNGFNIVQSRGACNKPTARHKEIMDLINANMGMIEDYTKNRVVA